MRPVGFSTGAIANGDFRRGIEILSQSSARAIELSALRNGELIPLLDAIDSLDLSPFSYISFHAPGQFESRQEPGIVEQLKRVVPRKWPLIVHPDVIRDFGAWAAFGELLCIENMDKRKAGGRTAKELGDVFRELPDAAFCFDVGHAHQVDPTMTEAFLILEAFGDRLREVHVSKVNTTSGHDTLSFGAILAFQEVAELIPPELPVILETPASEHTIPSEMEYAVEALGGPVSREQLDSSISHLLERGMTRSALVVATGWLEASLRQRLQINFSDNKERSNMPSLLEMAFAQSLIEPSERPKLLEWMRIRNAVVHLGNTLSERSAKAIVQDIRRITQEIQTH
jgi:hypothetical protein